MNWSQEINKFVRTLTTESACIWICICGTVVIHIIMIMAMSSMQHYDWPPMNKTRLRCGNYFSISTYGFQITKIWLIWKYLIPVQHKIFEQLFFYLQQLLLIWVILKLGVKAMKKWAYTPKSSGSRVSPPDNVQWHTEYTSEIKALN